MIQELRNQLDDTVFRRNRSQCFSKSLQQHNTMIEKSENIPLAKLEEDAVMLQQSESRYTEYKSRKQQNNTNQMPATIFGERLYKKIMEEKEERRLNLPKLGSETNVNKIPDECIVESDKENGSQFSINNVNEFNTIIQISNSETSYKKNSAKRLNEKDDTCKNKRLKIEDNQNKGDDIDYNHAIMQYDIKDDFTKLEELYFTHSSKRDYLEMNRRASSEYSGTKQAQKCRNEWKKQEETSSMKDYDNSRTRKGSIDSSRNRGASTSNEKLNSDYHHDDYINGHRKNHYRHGSSSSRSYSKSRSDYESSHRLREKSSRTCRDRRYDDYKYDSRHRNDRSRRSYDSRETGVRTRYSDRERGDLRDRLKHTMNDVEDKESRSGSYKSNRYDNRRPKETAATTSEDKRSYKDDKAVVENDDSQTSSNQIFVHVIKVKNSHGESIEQHSAKNETRALVSSAESTSGYATKNSSNMEEGEISSSTDCSPKKESDSTKISMDQVIKGEIGANATEITQVEDASGNTAVDQQADHVKSRDLIPHSSTVTKQLEEAAEIDTKQTESATSLSEENAENTIHVDTMQLNSAGEHVTDEMYDFLNLDMSKLFSYGPAPRSVQDHIEPRESSPVTLYFNQNIERNNNGDSDCQNCVDENLRDYASDSSVRLEEMYDFNNENNVRSEEIGDVYAEGTVEIDTENNPETDNNVHQTDVEDVKSTISKDATQAETVLDSVDTNQVSGENESSHQIPDNNNAEASRTCLDDHNYVRDTVIDSPNFNAVSSTSECPEVASTTTTAKETETEEANVQSVDTKKTSTVKNKKDQNSKAVVVLRRRKVVTLSDSNASMTVLINTDSVRSPFVADNSDKSDSVSKPRACKLVRAVKPLCK
ncbi:hypothetical protein EAI_05643 [Harpegnathos saltator]|uniref:Uncharacterized protein n=2 Tax=Harpegnathos saltator TaxID=610380 RepID=E2BUW7_HARSA|nr:hypothetical protein EAI_05643 [Harpegnathos saltator]